MTHASVCRVVVPLALSCTVTALVAAAAQSMSEAEKRYVAPRATTRIAEGLRTATPESGYGKKFADETTRPSVTISNPYMDPAKPLIAAAKGMVCTPDGGLVISGRAGFQDWRELHSRSVDAYPTTRHWWPVGHGPSPSRCTTSTR